MTPEERQLISGLFERMRGLDAPEKDRDAEALINQAVRATPDAAYMLVQSVLVQEHALQEAGNRIKDLEEQVKSLQGEGRERPSTGSFLGGLLGTGRPASEPRAGSVPQIGSRAAPGGFDAPRPSAWATPQPGAAQQQAAPAGGGFLRSAMATAAGVAGGMLAAGAIRDLMGGNTHTNPAAQQNAAASPTNTAEAAKAEQPAAADTDRGYQETADDGGSWFGDADTDFDV